LAAQYIVTKRNFDFHKLLDNIPKILDKGTKRLGRSAAKGAKERISKGLKPRLKASTLQLRRERGTGGTKPLFETGSLFRSIKANDEGFTMNEYGWYHEKGFTVQNVPLGFKNKGSNWQQAKPFFHPNKKIKKKVPARPFIFPSEKEILDPMKKIYMDMLKALSIRMKTIREI
tara:strand:+ start:505 stop:1023 length:519 start_codon:yes stop_codon:yes gene_type:complete